MDYKDLTPEQIEKLKGMTAEEIHRYVAEEGVSLSDEELEHVAGGWGAEQECPAGGAHEWEQTDTDFLPSGTVIPINTCTKCGATYRGYV